MNLSIRAAVAVQCWILPGVLLALAWPAALAGQISILHQEGYLTPPPEIQALVDAPRHESVLLRNLAPDGRFFLNGESDGPPSLADVAKPYLRLAGIAIDPAADRSRTLTIRGSAGYALIDWRSGGTRDIQVPSGAKVRAARWSPDGTRLAFLASFPDETHAYVADVATGQSRRVTQSPLLATRVTSVEWSGDGQYLFAVVVPEGRGAEPAPPAIPATPIIRVAAPEENRLRTYASLLKDPHEAELFEYHTTGQLVRIDVRNDRTRPIGSPAMIEAVNVSPLGDYVRVRTTRKPFSYIVPASRFGDLQEIWDLEGAPMAELRRRDVRDGAGASDDDDQEDEEPRRFLSWRPDGQGLSFVRRDPAPDSAARAQNEAGDEPLGRPVKRRDRVYQWLPPFDGTSEVELYSTTSEIRNTQYSPDMRWLFWSERSNSTQRLHAVQLEEPATIHTIYEWDRDDFYANPGSLMTADNELGESVVRFSADGEHVFLSGTQYFEEPEEEAPRPFIDRVEIRTGEKERIFESSPDMYERVTAVLDEDLELLMVTREGPTTVPDSWLLDRRDGSLRRRTSNEDVHPELTRAPRERITVTRADGIHFKVDVILPADYREGTRLPAMFWFYPREYNSQEAYDRSLRRYNKNRFPSTGPRSIEFLTARGYAVVKPDHPIVGPSDRINNSYVVDLRQNHLAVIDELHERGWIDRRRLGLGGHSYGGFGTINALVHTPYFRAGVAGAPNSNRLLTPIGFQSERRALWEARETYLEMSPFLWAERLTGALLIYHGEDDQNVGTSPANSWRLIHALNGLGKTAALYMYPTEEHGQIARETVLDMWARWSAWLDHYVKDAKTGEPVQPVPATAVTEPGDVEGEVRP